MKSLEKIKTTLAKHKPALQRKYNIRHIGIFGSHASGSAGQQSDVDILVEFEQPIGLDFVSGRRVGNTFRCKGRSGFEKRYQA